MTEQDYRRALFGMFLLVVVVACMGIYFSQADSSADIPVSAGASIFPAGILLMKRRITLQGLLKNAGYILVGLVACSPVFFAIYKALEWSLS